MIRSEREWKNSSAEQFGKTDTQYEREGQLNITKFYLCGLQLSILSITATIPNLLIKNIIASLRDIYSLQVRLHWKQVS